MNSLKSLVRLSSIAICLIASSPASIAAGDPRSGRELAMRWCASCHVVAPGQASASADVPTFRSIAGREDFTEALPAAFLSASHPRMPDMALTRREISDLVAYIRSLRSGG